MPAAGTITGGWDVEEEDASDMTPDSLADLLAGDTYFNIHTNRDTSGFIRRPNSERRWRWRPDRPDGP